jgi:hypothetical protein
MPPFVLSLALLAAGIVLGALIGWLLARQRSAVTIARPRTQLNAMLKRASPLHNRSTAQAEPSRPDVARFVSR